MEALVFWKWPIFTNSIFDLTCRRPELAVESRAFFVGQFNFARLPDVPKRIASIPIGLRGLRARLPDRAGVSLALLSAVLLICAFPDLNLASLAWVGLVPLLYAVVYRSPSGLGALLLGWITGIVYLIGTCYWLTYAMIHYGGIPTPVAYFLLVPPAIGVGLLYGGFSWSLHRLAVRWGPVAVWASPLLWIAVECLRFRIFGQLWNALGYSQAFYPSVIQSARWGGVYAISGLIVLVNAAIVYWSGGRANAKARSRVGVALTAGAAVLVVGLLLWGRSARPPVSSVPVADVVALQPSVPMEPVNSLAEMDELMHRHVSLSEQQLSRLPVTNLPRLVIWPESPMTFMYSRDTQLREQLADFAIRNRASLLINSLEPAAPNGAYNSAMLIDQNGKLVGQYDKIYLLPFGEFLPIPAWVPGRDLIPPIVGNFTAGERYPLLPVGPAQAGVVICFESAIPSHSARFATEGADVLLEITNDGYLGPTPVLKQHLSNAIFRAVENQRPVVRATNTGISALITAQGDVQQATKGFEITARTFQIARASSPPTFYARRGDILAIGCTLISLLLLLWARLSRPAKVAEEVV